MLQDRNHGASNSAVIRVMKMQVIIIIMMTHLLTLD